MQINELVINLLYNEGHYDGAIDGLWGKKTSSALADLLARARKMQNVSEIELMERMVTLAYEEGIIRKIVAYEQQQKEQQQAVNRQQQIENNYRKERLKLYRMCYALCLNRKRQLSWQNSLQCQLDCKSKYPTY